MSRLGLVYRCFVCIAFLFMLPSARAQVSQAAVKSAWTALTHGWTSIPFSLAAPSTAVVFGTALPIVATKDDKVVVAASTYGKGRVVVVTHEGLLPDLLANVAAWACASALKSGKVGVAYPSTSQDVTLGQLPNKNPAFQPSVPTVLPKIPPGTNLIVTGTLGPLSGSELNALLKFVKAGGGLIVAGHTWTWTPPRPDMDPLVDHPYNRLLGNVGILISQSTIDIPQAGIPISMPSALLNAVNAVQFVVKAASGKGTAPQALQDQVLRVLAQVQDSPAGLWRVSRSVSLPQASFSMEPARPFLRPLDSGNALKAMLVRLDAAQALGAPPSQVKASPFAQAFPSLSTTLKPANTTVNLKVDATYPGYSKHYIYADPNKPAWRSTGLYMAPGAKATISIPAAAVKARLSARIGCHTDDLSFKDQWVRAPVITRSIPLTATSTVIGSGYGGLLYIEVPAGAKMGNTTITIKGDLVPAPWFQLGTTTDADWRASVRTRPAPWAELSSPQFVLTVPSALVRTLDNPTALMRWWGRVLAAHASVAGLRAPGPFLRRPERLAADVDISVGYMHAGYPLMVFMDDGAPQALLLSDLQAQGNWGVFHELGHSMQWDDWVLPGTTEATVNIFSAHAMETVARLGRDQGYGIPNLLPSARAAAIATYKSAGRNFDRDWNVWTALETYLQLKEKFGWGLFPRLFAEYRGLMDADRPSSDNERVQQWVWRSCRAAGLDLVAFYEAWGFPLSDDTRRRVAELKLPGWKDHPML